MNELKLSKLPHTWIFDLDGTLLKHNGYISSEGDQFLPGAEEFLKSLPEADMIIILSARPLECQKPTEDFLRAHGIRYDKIIFDAPVGERIIVNDEKPHGLQTSIAVNVKRDQPFDLKFEIDHEK